MNFEVIRNISLFLSVSLFVTVSGLMVVQEETSLLSTSLVRKSAPIKDSVSAHEPVDWQYCNPFEIKRGERLPATQGPWREPKVPAEKPTLPDDLHEWVDVAQVNRT